MFTEHLNETMRRFVNELKLNRQRKQAAAARGRAIDCMELEDRILLSASPIAPTWLVNKTVVGVQQTTTQTSKTVAADASGNHVAVWSSQNADGSWTVNAQRFNSAGAALGTQIQVSSKTSLSQQNATVSMNANGTFVITWTNDNGSDSLVDVYAKQFTVNPDGSVKSGAESLVTSHTRDDQMNSSVAVNSSGGFVVTWSSQKEDGTGWAVYAERFDSSGNALGQAFKVEASDSNDQLYSRVATDAAGDFTVIWQGQDGDGSGIFGQRFDSSGNPLGTVFRANTTIAGNQQSADIAMNATGSFVVSWSTDGQDIYAQRFNADGSMAGNEFQVNTTTADESYGTIYTLIGGGTDIWGNSDQFNFASESVSGDGEIIARVDSLTYSNASSKAAVMFRDSSDPSSAFADVVVTPDCGLLFQWRSDGGDYAASTPSLGGEAPVWVKLTRAGNDFSAYYSMDGVTWTQIGDTETIAMQGTIQAGLAVTSHDNGLLCTAQFSNVTINGTTDFNLTDADIGSPALAGSYSFTDGFQVSSPTVAMDDSGAFLITWSSCDQDAPGSWGVYSQLYAASGAAAGPETRVNATTEGDQANSSVAFLSPTRYVVVWYGNGDGDESGMFSSVCDATLLGQDVNLAPVNNVPGDQSDTVNTPLVFSTANGNAIQISDPNIDPNDSSVDVPNSSFEFPATNGYAPTDAAWNFSYSDDGLYANSGIIPNGAWGNPTSPDGQQVAFIQGNGTIWQDVYFSEAGNYIINFQAAYRDYFVGSSPTFPVMVQVDGTTVGTITPNSTNYQGYSTDSFAVSAGTHTVSFIGMAPTDEDRSVFLDRVSIAKTESLVSVTLSVDHGTLSLPSLNVDSPNIADNGLVFSQGTGQNDTTMTFTGTLADVNAALDGLQYMPDANFVETAHLTIATNDLDSGAVGGAKTTTSTVAINVAAPSQYSGLVGSYVNLTDLALGKNATQSSDPFGWGASNAVDGDLTDANHTDSVDGVQQWWQVDLSPGTDTQLTQIVVYNRTTCGDRLSNFTISVIDSNGNTVWSQVYTQPTTDGERLVFDTGTISGEYVKIQKNDSNYLHLAEVQVYDYTPVTRVDPTVNFNWGYQGSPAPGIPGSNWEASWQGTVTADYSEDYTFYVTGDDGVRLWVNGQLLCDGWQDQSAEFLGTIHLQAGQAYSICLEYYQATGPESVKLEWSSASQAREVIPAGNLSCANLLGEENTGPVNTAPGEQDATINQPVVFSTDNGNAIQVSDPNASAASSVVFSSSFENPGMNWGDISGGQCGGGNQGGWNLTAWDGGVNESAIAANGSPYGNPDAPDGSQVLAIEGNATAWQDVTFSEAGNYTLNFLAAYTNDNQGWNWFSGSNPIAVQIDGVTVGTFTPGSNDHFDAFQTDSFTVAAGVHRVSFVGLTNDGSDRVSFVDNVSITKNADALQVTLSVNNGTLTLARTDGLEFISGDGVDDSSMTFLGTQSDINAALDGLQFMPTTVNFVGTANVQMTTTDFASFLNGGPKTTTSTIAINLSVPTSYQGLFAEYDNDPNFSALPTDRIDPTINFNWGSEGSPAPGVAGNSFTACWTGEIQATSDGTYTFRVTAADSGWLCVNGQWIGAYDGTAEGTVDNLVAGQWYSFQFYYQESGGGGQAKVEWLQPGQDQFEVIPASQFSCANLFQNQNQPPVNSVPGDQTGSVNTPLVFSTDNNNAISISDVDTDYDRPVQVTLSVDSGTLTLNSTDWLTFSNGDGTDDSTMTFTGWASDINWALNGLKYTPNAEFLGTANLTITTNDEAPIFSNGGPQSTTNTVAINVPAPSDYQGLLATYQNMDGSGSAVTRIDPTVDFDGSSEGSPAPGIEGTNWTATWQGTVTPDVSGNYTFYATADSGVRVWVDGTLVCDGWANQGPAEYSNAQDPIYLEGGQAYSIRMDYQGGGGMAKLEWSSDSGVAREVIPASNLSCADLVQHGNAAPVNNLPVDQTVGINSPLTFSSAHGNAITVGDPDIDPNTSSVPVGNSDFESPGLSEGDYVCGGNYGGWNLQAQTPNGDGTYSDSAIVANNNSSWYGTFTPAPTGQQVACIESQGTMWQDVNFAEAGDYTLSLLAAQSPSGYYWGASPTNPISVQVDGQSVGVIYPSSTDYQYYQTNSFAVTAGTHRISFTGLCPAGDDTETFIDNVAINKTNSFVQVTLSADHGTLSLAETLGLTFSNGSGQNDSSMTMVGTVADINAALDGLQLMPDANYQGACNVTVTTNDLAPAVSGGAKTTTDTVAVNVSIPTEYSGLLATYYDNTNLSGTGIQRIDPAINFSTGEVSLAPGIPGTNWSACWQGKIQATVTGTYTFYVTGDDGVRLWVNDASVDGWQYQSATTYTLTTDLVAGQWYTIRMEYFQGGGTEVANLQWSAVDQQGNLILPQEEVPTSQLSCENTAPVNTVPDQQTTDESTPLYFSSANGNAIQVSDIDTVDGTLKVTLNVDCGTLTLSNTNGLTFTDGANGSGAMTFTGAKSDINAALDGMYYTPALSESGGLISQANLTIATDDMASALTGGAKTTTSTVSIAITAPWQYNGLLGTYYNNADFTGTSVQRIDSAINFDWGNEGSPIQGIDGTTWSARWLGTITADETGTYTFYTTADDGVRLWVNGELLIDHLNNTGIDSYSATIDLVAGQTYSFRMDYQQVSGTAGVKLEWSAAGQPRQVISGNDFGTADLTPLNVIPSEQFGIGAQPIVFSESLGNTVGVVEADYDQQPLTVTLTATNGTLALGSNEGLTVTHSDDFSTITLTGSLGDINAALDGLTFTRQEGYLGSASIQITSTNPWPDSGPRSSTDTIQIGSVQSSRAGLVATYYSDLWLGTPVVTRIDSTINLDGSAGSPAPGVSSNNWSASWDGLIQISQTGNYTFYTTAGSGCRLWVNNQLVIDNWDPQAAATTSSINLTAGQQYSIRMEYRQSAGTDSVNLGWSAVDQQGKVILPSGVVPAGVLSHQDQSPVYYLPGAQTTNENTPLVFNTANGNAITISDVDAQSGLLQVTLTATNGSLTLGSVAGLSSVVYGEDNVSVTFTGHLDDINAALQGLTFNPTTNQSGGASLRITTTDLGTGKSADSPLPITVIAVNQPPTIDLSGSPTIYDYQTLTFSAASGNAIVIGDPDINPQTSSVAIVNGGFELFEPGGASNGTGYYSDQFHGTIPGWTLVPMYWTNGGSVPNSSGLAGNGAGMGNPNSVDGAQVAYIQGGATISQNVTFAEAGTYTISFQAAYRQYGGKHAFTVLVDGVSVGTFNPSSLDFRGYSATFSVSAGTHQITFRGATETSDKTAFIDDVSIAKTDSFVQVSLSVDHGTLNMSEKQGLVFAYGDGVDDTAMTFTGSLADVNAAIDSLQFTPYANYMGTANLRITTNDLGNSGIGGPKSTTKTLVINVLHVNDPPWNAVPSTTQGTYGNQPIVFSTAGSNGITVGDDDAGNNPIQVTLTVSDGVLTLKSTTGLTITDGANGSAGMTLTGTIANLNAALNGLSYTANSGYMGGDELQIHTDDLGNCGVGGAKTADSTVNISVLGGPVVNSTIDGTQQTSWQSPQAVASDANGNYVVVWSSNQNGNGWDIYARRFNASGNAQGDEFLVNSEQATGDQMYATVAMNADGSFVVTWTDLNGVGGSADIYARLYNADGSAKGGEFLVNTTTTGDQMYSSVAMGSDGSFVVTWSSQGQDGDGWGVYGQRFDASGDKVGPQEFQVNTTTSGDQMFARVATDGSGNFTVVWQGPGEDGSLDIYGQQFDASGAVGSEFQVNTTTAGDQHNANIGMNASGSFVVSWTSDGQDGNGQGIFAKQYNADGSVDPTYTVTGCGSDIWGTSDQFNYASTEVTGDVTMIAEVTSVTDTGTFAKCGVMFRDSLDPSAAHAMIYVNPDNMVVFQWRSTDGGDCTDVYSPGDLTGTVTVKLVRSGNDFSGYYSTDGVTWTQLGTTQTIAMGDTIQAGLEVSSWDANNACTATFRNVTINDGKDFTLTDRDIGSPNIAGSCVCSSEFQVATADKTIYTVSGAGNDIGGYSDQGNFASTDVTGDATLVAHVDSMTTTAFNAKAGVMLRDSSAPDSSYAYVFSTPGEGVHFQWRDGTGTWFQGFAPIDVDTSVWVKLTRTGDSFSGYYSLNGVDWIQIGSSQTLVMGNTVLGGLAVGSLNTGALCTAQFSHVTVNGTTDFVLNDADIGPAAIAGSCTRSDLPVSSADYSAVAVDEHGDFLVTWSGFGQIAPGEWGVYSQRYTAYGIAEGPQTRVNMTTDGSQAYSSVTSLSADNYMVVWSGSAPGEDAGVFYSEQSPVGLVAQYYNNMNLSGTPVTAGVAADVNYNWNSEQSPAPGVMGAEWSGTWAGMVKANTSEVYTFYATADDGVRVFINGQLLIDGWRDQGATTYSGSINMLAGQWYQIVVQYYNDQGGETLKLEWSSPSVVRQVIPCTQLTHYNQAPTITEPASLGATENTPLTISDYVSVPIENSSFESPNTRWGDYWYGGTSDGWTFTDQIAKSGSGIASNGSVFNNPDALNGNNAAFIQGQGTISQSIYFAQGGDYTLSLLAAYRDGYNGSNPIAVLIDGVNVGTITPTSTYYQLYQTSSFTVTAGTHTITFAGETAGGPDRTSFIDNVSIRSVNGNPIRIGDVDSTSSDPLTVTLSVTNGSLSLSGTDGLTMLAGDGSDDATMTFQGTASSINAALNGLVFTPDTDFRGQAVVQVVSSDTGGMGGPQTTISSVTIDVTGPNIPPVNTVPGDQSATEHQTLIFSTATGNAISVSDEDAGDLPVQVTLTTDHGTLSLSNVGPDSGLTFLNCDGVDDGTITVQGSMTAINAALDGLQFKPEDNYDGAAILSIETNDLGHCGTGGPQTASSEVAINVTAVNDPPVNVVPGLQNALTQYPLTFSDAAGNGIRITDPDAGDNVVQVTLSVDQGTLTLGSTDGLASFTGNGTGTITIEDTMDNINAALNGMTFQARSNFEGTAYLSISTDDLGHSGIGGPKTTTDVVAIKTTLVAPPAIASPSSLSVDEHQSIVFSQANGNAISVSDSFVGNLPVQVTLSADFGTLSLSGVKGLTFAPGSGPNGATMTFTGTIADVNAALEGMKFTPADFQLDATTQIHIRVNDLSLGYGSAYISQDATKTVSVRLVAVNDPPVITMPVLSENDPMRITFSAATGNAIRVSDPDIGNNPADMTIATNDSEFTLATTDGLQILGGSPIQSTFVMVRGTLDAINHALDGLYLKSSSSYGGIQITVNDRGDVNYQGIGGAQETTETLYVQRMIDPNFQPGDSGARFQSRVGVMNQPASMLAATNLLHDSQGTAKTQQIDHTQARALLETNVVQNMMLPHSDTGGERASQRVVNRGEARQTTDMDDVKDVKTVKEGQFSADVQNVNEPVQERAALRRDESILVGLGVVSAGYLAWAFNGGSLLAGALSATPMWMPFDPLAVLDFSDRATKSTIPLLDGEPGLAGEKNLQSLLN